MARKKIVTAKLKVYSYTLIKIEGDKVVDRRVVKGLDPIFSAQLHEENPGYIIAGQTVSTSTYAMPVDKFMGLAEEVVRQDEPDTAPED